MRSTSRTTVPVAALAILALLALVAPALHSDEKAKATRPTHRVLVELFTSQG